MQMLRTKKQQCYIEMNLNWSLSIEVFCGGKFLACKVLPSNEMMKIFVYFLHFYVYSGRETKGK